MRILINSVALLAVSYVLEGVEVTGFGSALVAAAVLGLVNVTLRPVLLLLTVPINIVTLGLFTFVVNAAMLMLVARVVAGFSINGFGSGLLATIMLSIVSSILSGLAGTGHRRR